jgi:hypothetical protein
VEGPDRSDRGADSAAGPDSVVDDEDGAAAKIDGRPVAAARFFPLLQTFQRGGQKGIFRRARYGANPLENERTGNTRGTDGTALAILKERSQQDQVERPFQAIRHFAGQRNTTSNDSENQRVFRPGAIVQRCGQFAAGAAQIVKPHGGYVA